MKKRVRGRKFGRTRSQRRVLLYGITASLFQHGRVRTTEARAKEARRIADRAITLGKAGTLVARRRLERSFSPSVVRLVVSEIAPRFQDRQGGYTRVVKLSRRGGDRAPEAFLELVAQKEKEGK